mmetsp:Transcript_66526/g.147351  ORF Transcript_66526/g.147351 Transcript_66526/m.147351 type:complete len:268 (+) Transcript_66526:386-1189(+)
MSLPPPPHPRKRATPRGTSQWCPRIWHAKNCHRRWRTPSARKSSRWDRGTAPAPSRPPTKRAGSSPPLCPRRCMRPGRCALPWIQAEQLRSPRPRHRYLQFPGAQRCPYRRRPPSSPPPHLCLPSRAKLCLPSPEGHCLRCCNQWTSQSTTAPRAARCCLSKPHVPPPPPRRRHFSGQLRLQPHPPRPALAAGLAARAARRTLECCRPKCPKGAPQPGQMAEPLPRRCKSWSRSVLARVGRHEGVRPRPLPGRRLHLRLASPPSAQP